MQPKFWKKKSLLSFLLLPLSFVYFIAGSVRNIFFTESLFDIPIICVGNVTVGGAGKTPVVLAITHILKSYGKNVAIASRGYKGELSKPTLVDKTKHTVNSVGDEPLILTSIAPTYIATHRPLAIEMAINNGANVVIMDDGMQNRSVHKNVTLLVIDGKYGIGNGCIIPAGPLRETLDSGVAKADAVIFIGSDDTGVLKHWCFQEKSAPPLIRAKLESYGNIPDKTKPYLAFAGIGNPDKFFATLAEDGFNVVAEMPFPDHYNYSDKDINKLISHAEKSGLELITTEKDAVRLPFFAQKKVKILQVRIVWENQEQIVNLLRNEKIIAPN
jgi:tetraacyldisaccharide 4'-kinase